MSTDFGTITVFVHAPKYPFQFSEFASAIFAKEHMYLYKNI